MPLSFAVSISEYIDGARRPPASDPAAVQRRLDQLPDERDRADRIEINSRDRAGLAVECQPDHLAVIRGDRPLRRLCYRRHGADRRKRTVHGAQQREHAAVDTFARSILDQLGAHVEELRAQHGAKIRRRLFTTDHGFFSIQRHQRPEARQQPTMTQSRQRTEFGMRPPAAVGSEIAALNSTVTGCTKQKVDERQRP